MASMFAFLVLAFVFGLIMASEAEQWLTIGKIKSPHGLKGLVRVRSFSDFPERFLQPGARWVQREGAPPVEMTLLKGSFQSGKNLYLVQFDKIVDRNAAEDWTGALVLVPASDRPKLAEEEYHLVDLIGLTVVERDRNRILGTVVSVIPAGNDLLEVQQGQKTLLIPFVKAFVPIVDLTAARIEVTPPLGLVPEDW